MRFKLILALITILLFAASCSNILNKGSISSGKGLVVNLLTSPNIQGETLNENEGFTVIVDVFNYLTSPIQGRICLRDKMTDSFGGVLSGSENCDNLNLDPAESFEDNKKLFPDQITFDFPLAGEYRYNNLDIISLDNQLFVDLFYELETQNTGTACVERRGLNKCEASQNLNLQSQDVPLDVKSIVASPSYRSNEIILNTIITLSKKEQGEILTPGSILDPSFGTDQKIRLDVEIDRQPADCQSLVSGYIEFKKGQNEKVIKCSSSVRVPLEYESIPVTVKMEYGFQKIIEGPKFSLKKESELIA